MWALRGREKEVDSLGSTTEFLDTRLEDTGFCFGIFFLGGFFNCLDFLGFSSESKIGSVIDFFAGCRDSTSVMISLFGFGVTPTNTEDIWWSDCFIGMGWAELKANGIFSLESFKSTTVFNERIGVSGGAKKWIAAVGTGE